MTAYILKYAMRSGVMVVHDAVEFGNGHMIREGRTFPIYRPWQWARTEAEAKEKFEEIKDRMLRKALQEVDQIEAAEFRISR